MRSSAWLGRLLSLGCLSAASRLPLGCLSAVSRLSLGCLSSHLALVSDVDGREVSAQPVDRVVDLEPHRAFVHLHGEIRARYGRDWGRCAAPAPLSTFSMRRSSISGANGMQVAAVPVVVLMSLIIVITIRQWESPALLLLPLHP